VVTTPVASDRNIFLREVSVSFFVIIAYPTGF
jgi:hypothetical protein